MASKIRCIKWISPSDFKLAPANANYQNIRSERTFASIKMACMPKTFLANAWRMLMCVCACFRSISSVMLSFTYLMCKRFHMNWVRFFLLIHIILCICTLIFNTYRAIPANSQLTAFLCRSVAAFCLFSIRSIYFCMHIECVFKEAAYFTDLFSVSHLLSHIDFSHSLHMDWIFSLGHFFFPLCFSLSRCALFIHDFFSFIFFVGLFGCCHYIFLDLFLVMLVDVLQFSIH